MKITKKLFFFAILVFVTGCENEYSTRNTLKIVKEIVRRYGIVRRAAGINGNEWKNIVIERQQDFEVDGVEYFLNSNNLPPEQVFHFDVFRFSNIPIFVEDRGKIPIWSAQFPDNTKLLSKIGRKCNEEMVLCGLECCPKRVKKIQKMILRNRGKINFQNRTYSTKLQDVERNGENKKICEFRLNFDDLLAKRNFSRIFYNCEKEENCCELSCKLPMIPMASAVRSYRSGSVEFLKKHFDCILTIISIAICVGTIILNICCIKRMRKKEAMEISKIKNRSDRSSDDSNFNSITIDSRKKLLP